MAVGLTKILPKALVNEVVGNPDIEVEQLTFNSRVSGANSCFFAIRGTQADGHRFIPQAVENGASAIVCEAMPVSFAPNVTYVRVSDSSEALGLMASAFYGNPSSNLKLVGVTGTNGKTTTATLLYRIVGMLGFKAGLLSTVVNQVVDEQIPTTHTTPDPIELNRLLRRMVDAGCSYCFMEVSSHAVVQKRIAGLTFAGGIFTNITHDHLDYHKTFDEYIRAKKMFFDQLPSESFALVNADDRNGMVMVQNTKAKVSTYALHSIADFRCRVVESHFDGMLLNMDGL